MSHVKDWCCFLKFLIKYNVSNFWDTDRREENSWKVLFYSPCFNSSLSFSPFLSVSPYSLWSPVCVYLSVLPALSDILFDAFLVVTFIILLKYTALLHFIGCSMSLPASIAWLRTEKCLFIHIEYYIIAMDGLAIIQSLQGWLRLIVIKTLNCI